MTDEQLKEIEERANAATAGPWESLNEGDGMTYFVACGVTQYNEALYLTGDIENELDAAFIAAAREDVPALVAEVRRLCAGWISVKDRLPADREPYLIATRWDMRVSMGRTNDGDDLWYDYRRASWVDDVTHWMPLPAPPAVEARAAVAQEAK